MRGSNGCAASFPQMTPDALDIVSNAGRLQTLFVRLLFCDVTYERYRADRPALAHEFGIDIGALSGLPDPDALQLIAERHGRKTGVLIEVKKTFARAYALIEALPEYSFADFLCSDAFFNDASGLPHPYGVGPGYENASKFFFWVRSTLRLDGSAARLNARLTLNGDFAAYLIDQNRRGAVDYYRRFANGIYWREAADNPLPIILMTAQLDVYRISDANQYPDLQANAIDLDGVAPEPPARRQNIF